MQSKKPWASAALAAAVLAGAASVTSAQEIFAPGDFVIAIDADPAGSLSRIPGEGENAAKAIDGLAFGDTGTKYLNFAKENSGFIVTPAAPSTVQSMTLVTANDREDRDPASYALFGTNGPVTSTRHSLGNAETWTLISQGSLSLPIERRTLAPTVDIANSTAYNSYRLIFPTLRDTAAANSMQIGEVQFFTAPGAGGNPILAPTNPIVEIDTDPSPNSRHPTNEGPANAIDQNVGSKYLNFGKENSGLIVTPQKGATVAKSMRLVTANDAPGRDPARYEIYGTNNAITSTNNSQGLAENWTLISSGVVTLPGDPAINNDARGVPGELVVFANNNTPYTSYRILFPDNKADVANADSIQFAEVQIFDQVPEPGTIGLVGVAVALLGVRRRNA